MRVIEFFGLMRAAQDHFLDALRGEERLAPLAVSLGGPKAHRAGWVASGVGVLVLVVLFVAGYGDLGSALAVQARPWVLAWVLAFALAVGGALHALAGDRATASLPWRAGVYVFPSALIDARTHELRRYDVDELTRIDASGRRLSLHVGSASFSFDADAEAVRAALEASRALPSDDAEREADDPLTLPRMTSPLAPQHPHVRQEPSWAHARVAIAVLLGLTLGPAIWYPRNAWSDGRAFAAARARDEVAAYAAYLQHGWRHRDVVARVLLPRAELELARRRGSVDAILDYRAAHAGSAIQSEVDAALRTALLAELGLAKKAGTLAALEEFVRRRPAHDLERELTAARHDVYVAALARFRAVGNDKDPVASSLVERLLVRAERTGNPKVEIRFQQQPSATMPRADSYVAKQEMFNGEASYPSRYFGHDRLVAHEEQLGKALAARLSAVFPAEVLTFVLGASVPAGEVPVAVTTPTLVVVYRVEWTGLGFPSYRPRGIVVGVEHRFDAAWRLPDESAAPAAGGKGASLEAHAVLVIPVPLKALKPFADIAPKPGEPEAAVYGAMCAEAFQTFGRRILSQLLRD